MCVCVWWWWCHVGAVRGSQHVWQGLTPLHLALKHVTTDALDVVSLLVFVDKSTVGLSGPVRMGGGLRLLVWPPTHVLATHTSQNGWTAMHFAAQNAAPEVVDFLITEDPDSVVTASDVRMRGIPCRHASALCPRATCLLLYVLVLDKSGRRATLARRMPSRARGSRVVAVDG